MNISSWFEIAGINGTQITSSQRAAHLEWYILFNCKHNLFFIYLQFVVYLWIYIFRHHPLFVTVQLHTGLKNPCLKLNASCIFPMPWKWMRCIIISLGHACSVWTRARWKHPFGKHLSQVRNQLNCTVLLLLHRALLHCQESVCTATIQRIVKQFMAV